VHSEDVEKMDPLLRIRGCQIWSTDQVNTAVMEWESESECRLALAIALLLRKHAVQTNFVRALGHSALLVIRLEPLGLGVSVRAAQGETVVTFVGPGGEKLDRAEAEALCAIKAPRFHAMEDAAAHAARSLRAHLAAMEVHELTLHLRFGTGPEHETLLQVINPAECDFGAIAPEALLTQLGGDSK